MVFREAEIKDITQIQRVRNSVKENQLSNPNLVPDHDVEDYITRRGRGWVCETGQVIIGFAIVSLVDKNVWALFVQPEHDKKGIGRRLHREMMTWYFTKTNETVWLSTAPGTRAERFYRQAGWRETGITKNGEIKFEMTAEEWLKLSG